MKQKKIQWKKANIFLVSYLNSRDGFDSANHCYHWTEDQQSCLGHRLSKMVGNLWVHVFRRKITFCLSRWEKVFVHGRRFPSVTKYGECLVFPFAFLWFILKRWNLDLYLIWFILYYIFWKPSRPWECQPCLPRAEWRSGPLPCCNVKYGFCQTNCFGL